MITEWERGVMSRSINQSVYSANCATTT